MRNWVFIVLVVFFLGCVQRSPKEYKSKFLENREKFLFIRNVLQKPLEGKNTELFYCFEVTGRRTVEYTYINDSTVDDFNNIPIAVGIKNKVTKLMYSISVNRAFIYQDSVRFIFKGRYKDTIIIYNSSPVATRGILIDTNTYLILDKN